jgi:hypothetical protein
MPSGWNSDGARHGTRNDSRVTLGPIQEIGIHSKTVSTLLVAIGLLVIPANAQTGSAARKPTQNPAGSSCNRRCLMQILTDYTEALTDNDPAHLAVSPRVRVTSMAL